MSSESKKMPRPVLSGLYDKQVKRNLIMTLAVTLGGTLIYFVSYLERRKKNYAEYYKKDMDQEFEDMMKTGVFDSCREK